MAVFHFNCKYLSRAGETEKNAVRAASYCAGTKLSDLNTDKTYNYSKKREVIFSEIQAPANSPEWVADRQRLWSEVEKKENRYDAKLMTQFEVSLPHELDEEQSKALMYDFVSGSLVKRGMIADWSIHWLLHNRHSHVNTTTREITGAGFGKKVREWEEKKTLFALRKEWAECANKHLEMAGFDIRIDHRSFKDQGIDHKPTIHVGPERSTNQHLVNDRKRHNRKVRHRNQQRDKTIQAEENLLKAEENFKASIEQLEQIKFNESKIKNLKKRIVHSLDGVQLNIIKPTVKTFYPMAHATLMSNLHSKIFPPEYIKPPINTGILESNWDLRLPNGRMIYVDSYEALEHTISVWELNQTESDSLRKKFWELAKESYWLRSVEKALKMQNQNMATLKKFKPSELRQLKNQSTDPNHLANYLLAEYKRRSSLPYYFEKVCELGKSTANLKPENFNPLQVCYGFETAASHASIVKDAAQRKNTYQIPIAIRHMLEGDSKSCEYQDVYDYCSNNNLTMGQLWDFMQPWWAQITFEDYHSEIKRIALSYNRTMRLDMIPIDKIKQSLEDCVSPEEFVRNISGPPGGNNGFNPTPGPLRQTNTPQPRTPWNTPTPGSGFGI